MAHAKTEFDRFLEEDLKKCRGVYYPVKTGFLRRMLTKKAEIRSLHPNPEDEFCDPEIGPNYRIISEYQEQFAHALGTSDSFWEGDPIFVERLYPDGYRILNGHHRWAAAMRLGRKSIPIRIVNMAHEEDVKRVLESSRNSRRAAFDLDEVVFRAEEPLETALSFPWDRLYPQRLRLGVPALFRFLSEHGYDIWLYSAEYYSADSIHAMFRRYGVEVDGVMAGIGKRRGESGTRIEKLISENYRFTAHIDGDAVLQIFPGSGEYREFRLSGDASAWSREVMDAVEEIEKQAGEEEPAP